MSSESSENPKQLPDLDLRRRVAEACAEVRAKAQGRTRYEGQPPYVDELLVAEIDRLTALLNRNLVMVDGEVYDHRDIVRMKEQLAHRLTDSWPDPNGGCPVCGGPTETDREDPPNPYVCEDCKNETH